MKALDCRCLLALATTAAMCCASSAAVRAFDCCGCPPCGNRTGLYGCHCFANCCGTCNYGTSCSGCCDCNPCGGPMCASWRPSLTTDCWPGLTYSYACNTSRGFVDGCDCGPYGYSGGYSEHAMPVEHVSPAPVPVQAAPSSCNCNSHASTTRGTQGYRVVRQAPPTRQRGMTQQGQIVQRGPASDAGQHGRMPSQHRTVSGYTRRAR
ncbi:MAG: hypothetical protein AB7U73_02055 [Pirellulales bacterium]